MKRTLAVMASLVSLSLFGCGGAPVESEPAPAQDPGTGEVTAQAACTSTMPSCDALDLTYCGKRGLTTSCCLGTNAFTCTCTSAGWACP